MFVWHFGITFLMPLHRLELRRALTMSTAKLDKMADKVTVPSRSLSRRNLLTITLTIEQLRWLLRSRRAYSQRWISWPVMRKQLDNKCQFQIRPKENDAFMRAIVVRHDEHSGYFLESSRPSSLIKQFAYYNMKNLSRTYTSKDRPATAVLPARLKAIRSALCDESYFGNFSLWQFAKPLCT